MFVRLGEFEVRAGMAEALHDRYYASAVPLVRSFPGNVDAYLLEPANAGEATLACTLWETEADARAYEGSGTAAAVVMSVREFFTGPPTLRSFHVHRH